jgi:uncharacterized protein (DUF1499 family)
MTPATASAGSATSRQRNKRIRTVLLTALTLLLVAAALLLTAGQAGLFRGKPPSLMGVQGGRLPPPYATPNNVHSQAAIWGSAYAHTLIEPLPAQSNGQATMARLRRLIEATPGAQVVKAGPDYLYVQYTTKWMKFVDDAEFWLDPAAGIVQVRSASRLGKSDLGVNRARIEDLRKRLSGGA